MTDIVRRKNTKMLVFCLQELLQVSGTTDVVRRQNTKMSVFCCKDYYVSGRKDVKSKYCSCQYSLFSRDLNVHGTAVPME